MATSVTPGEVISWLLAKTSQWARLPARFFFAVMIQRGTRFLFYWRLDHTINFIPSRPLIARDPRRLAAGRFAVSGVICYAGLRQKFAARLLEFFHDRAIFIFNAR